MDLNFSEPNLALPDLISFPKTDDPWNDEVQPITEVYEGYNSYKCQVKFEHHLGNGHYGSTIAYKICPRGLRISDRSLNTRAAIKTFEPGEDGEYDFLIEKTINEDITKPIPNSSAYDQQSSQCVAKYLGFHVDGRHRQHSLVSELIPGSNLEDQIKSQSYLSPQTKMLIIAQISAGLSWVHKHGYIHRDLKPDNIMYDPQSNAKTIDFGYAVKISDYPTNPLESEFTTVEEAAEEIINGTYCAPRCTIPIEVFRLEQEIRDFVEKYDTNKPNEANINSREDLKKFFDSKIKALFRPSYDMFSIATLILKLFFGTTKIFKKLANRLINRTLHTDLATNINGRMVLFHLIKDPKIDLAPVARYGLFWESIKLLIEPIQQSTDLIEYLNNELPLSSRLSPEQTKIIRLMCLLCMDEDPEKRPLTSSIGYLAELSHAGMTDIKSIINCTQQDLSEKEFLKITEGIEKYCAV